MSSDISVTKETLIVHLEKLLDRAAWILSNNEMPPAPIATEKTIGPVIKRYADGLSNLVYDAFNHRIDEIDMRRMMKAMIRDMAGEMIVNGWQEGGLKEEDIEDDDQEWADEQESNWIAGQIPYVNDFSKATYEAGDDKDARREILDRMQMWIDQLRDLGEVANAYALHGHKFQWELGNRQNHTEDCIKLSRGKPHRLQWYMDRGYIPGQIHLGCGCLLRDVATGEVVIGGD